MTLKEKLPRKYKVKQFARVVLNGIVEQEDSDQYLGKRHWSELHDYFFRHTIGFIPELTVGYESRYQKLAGRIMDYARYKEAITETTADDELAEALAKSTQVGPGDMNFIGNWYWGRQAEGLYWSRLKRSWYRRDVSKTWVKRVYAPWGYRDEDMQEFRREWLGAHFFDASEIAERFLLDPNSEVNKIKHKSPGALAKLVRSQPKAVEQRTGLRWEKPIPQVA